jgi:DNA-binding SARP family transcriptional activator
MPEALGRDASRARVLFAAGVIAALQGQGGAARQWLEESTAIAREVGDRSLAAYSDSYIGIALGQEGLAAAEAPTREALAWFEQSGDLYGKRLALVVLVTLLLKEAKLVAARAMGEDAVRVATAYGLGRELGIALQVLGTVQLHQGELDTAASTIANALRALRRDPQAFWLARAMELMGVLECLRGHPVHAARLFGAAEARRERMGAVLFQLDRERLAPHIAAARAAAGDGPFAEAWATGRALPFEAATDVAISGATPPRVEATPVAPSDAARVAGPSSTLVLSVRTLGPVEIERDGVPVPHSAWKYARPRELFLYLLTHPEGRAREQIGLAFWPDASPAQVKNNFHVMLHHLRRALGRADLVVFEKDCYRVNWELGIELDAVVFEREAVAARRALRANPRSAEASLSLRTALDGYRGGFLEDENAGDWHMELREHLHRVYVDGLIALGAYFADVESWIEAAEVYRRVVSADELNEDAHRRLMSSLARAGQRGEALRHFDRFAAVLRRDLGAAPERQTSALYDQLRKAEFV